MRKTQNNGQMGRKSRLKSMLFSGLIGLNFLTINNACAFNEAIITEDEILTQLAAASNFENPEQKLLNYPPEETYSLIHYLNINNKKMQKITIG